MTSNQVMEFLQTSWQYILNLVAPLGGVGAVIWFFANRIGNARANRMIEETKAKHNKELALLNTKLEIAKSSKNRYNEKQFEIYNELWGSLLDLKKAGDQLWLEANQENLQDFADQLKQTQEEIDRKSIFIELDHYTRLNTLNDKMLRFSIGKSRLINARRRTRISEDEIDQIIESNHDYLETYINIIDEIRSSFRDQLN